MDANPEYKILGFLWFIGMILFGIAVFRAKFYPAWSGYVIIIGTNLFTVLPLSGSPMIYVNITNILFSITMIYISTFGLISLKKD